MILDKYTISQGKEEENNDRLALRKNVRKQAFYF